MHFIRVGSTLINLDNVSSIVPTDREGFKSLINFAHEGFSYVDLSVDELYDMIMMEAILNG